MHRTHLRMSHQPHTYSCHRRRRPGTPHNKCPWGRMQAGGPVCHALQRWMSQSRDCSTRTGLAASGSRSPYRPFRTEGTSLGPVCMYMYSGGHSSFMRQKFCWNSVYLIHRFTGRGKTRLNAMNIMNRYRPTSSTSKGETGLLMIGRLWWVSSSNRSSVLTSR